MRPALLALLLLLGCEAPVAPEPAGATPKIDAARTAIADWLLSHTVQGAGYLADRLARDERPAVIFVSAAPTPVTATQLAALQSLSALPVAVGGGKRRADGRLDRKFDRFAEAYIEFEGLGSATRQTLTVGLRADEAHSWRARLVVLKKGTTWTTAQVLDHVPAPAWKAPFWSLKIAPEHGRAWGLHKVSLDGALYYYFLYTVTNPESRAIDADLRMRLITDRVATGVAPVAVRPWNSFRRWKLPADPGGTFDSTPEYRLQKQVDDRAVAAVLERVPGWVHSRKITRLEPGQSVKGVAVFARVDPNMDYCGILVRGLRRRILHVGKDVVFEDRQKLFRYHSPGSASTELENPIIARRPAVWKVVKRLAISFPR